MGWLGLVGCSNMRCCSTHAGRCATNGVEWVAGVECINIRWTCTHGGCYARDGVGGLSGLLFNLNAKIIEHLRLKRTCLRRPETLHGGTIGQKEEAQATKKWRHKQPPIRKSPSSSSYRFHSPKYLNKSILISSKYLKPCIIQRPASRARTNLDSSAGGWKESSYIYIYNLIAYYCLRCVETTLERWFFAWTLLTTTWFSPMSTS